jgi:hypothetical protein
VASLLELSILQTGGRALAASDTLSASKS